MKRRLKGILSLSLILLASAMYSWLHLAEPSPQATNDYSVVSESNRDNSSTSFGKIPPKPPRVRTNPIEAKAPDPQESQTYKVKVGFFVDNNYEVNLVAPMFASSGYYWQRWSPDLQAKLESLNLDLNSILSLSNQVETWDNNVKPLNEKPIVLKNGDYYQIFSFSEKFYIPNLNLRRFPFNQLNLPITLEVNDPLNSFQYNNLRLIPDRGESGIGQDIHINGLVTLGWDMTEARHVYKSSFGLSDQDSDSETSYSRLSFTVKYGRSLLASFWSLLQPLLIVMAIVMLSPQLSGSLGDVRIAIPATAILTLVFMQAGYKADLPPLPYLTFLDNIYRISYGICLAAFGLFVWGANQIDNCATEAEREKALVRINRIDARFQFVTATMLLLAILVSWLNSNQ